MTDSLVNMHDYDLQVFRKLGIHDTRSEEDSQKILSAPSWQSMMSGKAPLPPGAQAYGVSEGVATNMTPEQLRALNFHPNFPSVPKEGASNAKTAREAARGVCATCSSTGTTDGVPLLQCSRCKRVR